MMTLLTWGWLVTVEDFVGDLRRQPRCFGRHAVAGKLQGAEYEEAEVIITKKVSPLWSCAAEIIHDKRKGSPNRNVKERRPFVLGLHNENCVCKFQSIKKDIAQGNKLSAGDYMEFSAKGPLCEQYRLATSGLTARLDHRSNVLSLPRCPWRWTQLRMRYGKSSKFPRSSEPNKCPIILRNSVASEI